MDPDLKDAPEPADDFFLPDLCQAQSILFLVLIAELLVVVVVLAGGNLINFDWTMLGLTSLFVQWVVLASAALLCNFRPVLMRMSTAYATVMGYALILSLTLIFSVIGEWMTLDDMGWDNDKSGIIIRNVLVAAVMSGIAFRYFFLQHQLRQQEQAELNSRIQALQSRIRPHFLFNSMNIIASLISIDPETAETVVEDLSMLFRASLNDSSNLPVPLAEELDLCRKYVHIESLLTLQPLLENAIYHGIQPRPEGGEVVVNIQSLVGKLVATISNPLPSGDFSREPGNRMAVDNIKRRLEAIYGTEASITSVRGDNSFTTTISYPLDDGN